MYVVIVHNEKLEGTVLRYFQKRDTSPPSPNSSTVLCKY